MLIWQHVCARVCVCVRVCTNMIFALRTLLAKLKIKLNRWELQYWKNVGKSSGNTGKCLMSAQLTGLFSPCGFRVLLKLQKTIMLMWERAERRGSLKSVQITQGAVSQFAATERTPTWFFLHQRSPDLWPIRLHTERGGLFVSQLANHIFQYTVQQCNVFEPVAE